MIPLPQLFTKAPLLTLLILLVAGAGLQAQCPVNASFTHPQSYICQGTNLTFTNTTTGGAIGQAWYENVTLFSTQPSPSRTFNIPGPYIISLVATNGSCADTAQSAILVSPTLTGSLSPTNPTCFGGTNGSVNLTPGGGTPNICINNNRSISDYTAANTVCGAGYGGGITIEAWVKPRSTWTSGDGLFVAFNQSGGSGNRFFVGYNPGFQQFVYFDDNLGNQFYNGTQVRGAWYHIAVTITSGNVVSMYLNGTLNRTVNTNAGWIPQAGDQFSIGQEWDFSVLSQHFDGWIDEVRVWNAVLSPSTILNNRNSCMGINSTHPNWGNIVAYYSMNEGSGTYIFDRSGKNNHGQRVNGSVYGTPAETNWGCFSAGTGYGYNWSTGATTEDISGLSAGSYTVTLTDGAGVCNFVQSTSLTNPAQVVVSINPPGPVSLCAGSSTSLTASGANTYSWSPGTGLSGTTGPSVTASPSSTITYTCVGTNVSGCTGQSTVQVVVNPLPTATITGNNTICAGQSTTLTGGGGTGYAWSNGPTTAANTVSPTGTTSYTVTVTDANSCTDTESMTVTVNPLPTVSFTGMDTICTGDTTTLTASGGTGYVWNNGPTTATNTVFPSVTTSYSVTVTDANSCQNADTITVVVHALPMLSFAGADTICDGDTTQITVSGASTYLWGHGPTTASVSLSPLATTYYDVLGTDVNGCEASDSVEVVVNPTPTVTIMGADSICAGDSAQLTGSGASTYLWSTSATTAAITVGPTVTTTYTLTGTNASGCSGDAQHTVTVNPLPVVTITGQDSICEGDTITLVASGGGSYLWTTSATTASITVVPPSSTSYGVTVTDGNGCEGSASHSVVVNALPTTPVITQNGNVLSTGTGYASYQWYFNGSAIPGATSSTYTASLNGDYTVVVTNAEGCTAVSAVLPVVIIAVNPAGLVSFGVRVYPNPNAGLFTVQLDLERDRNVTLRIFDLAGKQVWGHGGDLPYGEWKHTLHLGDLPKGTYLLDVTSEGQRVAQRVVIQ